jgi:RHH-type proline utilization regulon transcriptional repressor/proline dehydrogenase/delta 1-pyrroline-5-carboxylate dehydrogenase
MQRLGENADFRVQALRFIDVLPALNDDKELTHHLNEYFTGGDFPLPEGIKWGMEHAGGGIAAHLVAPLVRKAVKQIGGRFIAGESADDAYRTIEHLHQTGMQASLDILGEAVLSEEEADHYQKQYLDLIEALSPNLKAIGEKLHLSIKASSLYSQINPLAPEHSSKAIRARLRPILRAIKGRGGSITLDMERFDTREIILRTFREILSETEFVDWPDCGIAIQAYLTHAEADLETLIEWAEQRGAPIHVRLVRGAYWDEETVVARREGWDVPVWEEKWQTDASYERCLKLLMTHHHSVKPVIASHNVRSIALALAWIEEHKLAPPEYEFQMLYGIAEDLQTALAATEHPLRIYVPVGPIIPGMAYLVRRLLENSANTSFLRLALEENRPEEELLAAPQAAETKPAPAVSEASSFRNEPMRRFTQPVEREGLSQAIRQVRSELGQCYPLMINGKSVETSTIMTSVNPACPSEVIGEVTMAGTADADAAVKAAGKALTNWRQRTATERGEYLRRIATLLGEQRDMFAAWEILEAGKPWREADADVTEAMDYLRYYAGLAETMEEGHDFNVAGETNCYTYQPRGIAVVIPPWNFPLAILTGMLAASLAAGNTAIVKPSSQTPVIAAKLMALLQQAGIPDGVVNFLPGEGARLGEYLVRHPDVHLIAFTGSMKTGCRIRQLAADGMGEQHHVKQVIAEMGGKNAIIVDTDADMDDAVAGILASAFGYAGQKCSACSRVITVGNIHDALVHRLKEGVQSLIIGPPEEPSTFVGPVISESAKNRIMKRIRAGKSSARLAAQADMPSSGDGYFVPPTIFTEVSASDALAQEEIFGPVLAVLRTDTFDAAIGIANGTRYALTGGVYSRSPAHLTAARQSLDVGNLYLNRKITSAMVGRQPFGGFAMSGMGYKAGGPDYLLQFMQAKTVTENTLRRGFAPDSDGH